LWSASTSPCLGIWMDLVRTRNTSANLTYHKSHEILFSYVSHHSTLSWGLSAISYGSFQCSETAAEVSAHTLTFMTVIIRLFGSNFLNTFLCESYSTNWLERDKLVIFSPLSILTVFISRQWTHLTNDHIVVRRKSRHSWFRPSGTFKKFRRGRTNLRAMKQNRFTNHTASYTIKNPVGELFTYTPSGKVRTPC